MRVLGIDPGIDGGAAIVEREPDATRRPRLVAVRDLPTMGEGPKRELNGAELLDWLVRLAPDMAWIENVTAMPSIPGADGVRRGMGAASAFKFGMGVGAVRGVIQAAKVPYQLVVPASWKKFFSLKGGDKEPSRQLAIRRWPESQEYFARKKDHQRAEAALVALYGITVRGDS